MTTGTDQISPKTANLGNANGGLREVAMLRVVGYVVAWAMSHWPVGTHGRRADGDDRLIRSQPRAGRRLRGPVAGGDVSGQFGVTAAQVLHERVPGEDARGPVALTRLLSG